jgi:hypothetical protein
VKENRLRASAALLDGGRFNFHIRQRSNWKSLPLMGAVIDTGPVGLQMTRCSLESPDEFRRKYEEAEEGQPVPLQLRVDEPSYFVPPKMLESESEEEFGSLEVEPSNPRLPE